MFATLILVSSIGAPAAPTFVVENHCPFVVTNCIKEPCTLCGDTCKCPDGACPNGCPVKSTKTETTTVTTLRAPHGHSHTCTRCGTTWDHDANPTHQCRNCGASQYVIDTVPKMIPTTTVVSAPKTVQYQLAPASSSGCANGQCSVPSRNNAILPWRR